MPGGDGWVKIHRRFLGWEWAHKPEMVALFVHLLLMANHEDGRWQGVQVKRGQIVTGRKKLAAAVGMSEKTVRTCLTRLKGTGEVAIKTASKFSLITLIKYEDYQARPDEEGQQNGQHSGQQRASKGPAKGHKLEVKTARNTPPYNTPPTSAGELFPAPGGDGAGPAYSEIIAYLNERAGKAPGRGFRPEREWTRRHIRARWNEGYRLEDFRRVVDNLCRPAPAGWLGDPKMEVYLRPQTLFGTKFESYLNAGGGHELSDREAARQRYQREKWARWEARRRREKAGEGGETRQAGGNGGGQVRALWARPGVR